MEYCQLGGIIFEKMALLERHMLSVVLEMRFRGVCG